MRSPSRGSPPHRATEDLVMRSETPSRGSPPPRGHRGPGDEVRQDAVVFPINNALYVFSKRAYRGEYGSLTVLKQADIGVVLSCHTAVVYQLLYLI